MVALREPTQTLRVNLFFPFIPKGSPSCSLCPENTFNPNWNSTSSSACEDCPDQEVSEPGSSECSQCRGGSYYDDGECVECPIGTFGKDDTCYDCPVGTYNDEDGQMNCKECPFGTFNDQPGAVSLLQCLTCPRGSFSSLGAANCTLCPLGTFNDAEKQESCQPCPVATFGDIFGAENISSCLPCPKGTASSIEGVSTCEPCSLGHVVDKEGSTQCELCDSGSFANVTGLITCHTCAPGTFNSYPGQSICMRCFPGSFSKLPGSTNCTECEPGYSSPGGDVSCSPCAIGTYSNETGSPCLFCPPGETTETEGSQSCVPGCGNGRLDPGEFCDDGNLIDGDGCSSTCTIEAGFICLNEGQACERNDQQNGGDALVIILGIFAGVLLISIIVFLVVFLLWRNGKKRDEEPIQMDPLRRVSIDLQAERENAKIYLDPSMLQDSITMDELDGIEDAVIIGTGAFGFVFRAKYKGKDVAVKDIRKDAVSESEIQAFIDEAELMRKLPG